jgi:hypothetical protein
MAGRLRRFRDTITGRYTTQAAAAERPATTVAEQDAATGGWKVLSGTDNHIVLLWHVRRANGVVAQRFLVECADSNEPTIRPLS